ncbi:MAG: ThiF family adenylyltransferase [Chloroflexota bacterium]
MQSLNIEPTYRVLLGDVSTFRILLVGAGGTGSALALALAGLAYHARQKGVQVDLTLIDHDTIQSRNVGRQQFGVASALAGDVYKVSDLALRLNAAYGLDVSAWPERYEAGLASMWFNHNTGGHSQPHLIIGCVDNHLGRREIARTVEAFHGRLWAMDAGNEQFSGQVLVGNMTNISQITLDHLGLCSGLPSPYIQEPDLLEPEGTERPPSCAEMAMMDEQSLMVNRVAAAIAGQLVYNFVLRRQVTQLGVYFNLEPTVMTPVLVTRENINRYRTKGQPALTG